MRLPPRCAVLALALVTVTLSAPAAAAPEPTPEPTPTAELTPTPESEATPPPEPEPTAEPDPTPTVTPEPTAAPTPTASAEPTPVPAPDPTPTPGVPFDQPTVPPAPQPTPQSAPVANPAPGLPGPAPRIQLAVTDGVATVDLDLRPTTAKRCPKATRIGLDATGHKSGELKRLKVTARRLAVARSTSGACRVTGTLRIAPRSAAGSRVTLVAKAKGYRTVVVVSAA